MDDGSKLDWYLRFNDFIIWCFDQEYLIVEHALPIVKAKTKLVQALIKNTISKEL
jgi:hypothetical protein